MSLLFLVARGVPGIKAVLMALSYRRTFIDVELLDKRSLRSLSCPPPAIGLEMCEKTFCENEANYVAQVKDLHHRIFFEEALRSGSGMGGLSNEWERLGGSTTSDWKDTYIRSQKTHHHSPS